jgi:hypothetical protein
MMCAAKAVEGAQVGTTFSVTALSYARTSNQTGVNMKSLRQILATATLTLVITLSASAGEMGAGIVQPPPPPSVTGEMGAGNAATAGCVPIGCVCG